MPYRDSVTWKQLEQGAESATTQLINSLENGENRYQKWQQLRGIADNAQVATKLGGSVTEAMVVDLDAAYNAMHQMYLHFTNQAGALGDHIANCRDFSA